MKLVAGLLVTLGFTGVFARQVAVSTEIELMNAMQNAVADDTVVVAPGIYVGDMSKSGDPGNLPNSTGYFWVGNNGTKANPIVVVGRDQQNPPVLKGTSISAGYVVHVTGEHVVLKNLIVTQGDKGVIFDNASYCAFQSKWPPIPVSSWPPESEQSDGLEIM